MTPRGHWLLKDELRKLKAQRPEIAKAIEIARGHGDLSENADYDAAKNKSGLTEAKIRELESVLAQAEVIDPSSLKAPKRVVFGACARIADVDSGEEKTVSIYGIEESDVSRGWISYESPLGKALIGKEAGDTVQIRLPNGQREYEVLEVFVDYQWRREEQSAGERVGEGSIVEE